MKLALLCLSAFLFTACTSIEVIDNRAEAAKIMAAGQTYRKCIADQMLRKQSDIDLHCRLARLGLLQAVRDDPRAYDKSLVFTELAKTAILQAKDDYELAKDAAH